MRLVKIKDSWGSVVIFGTAKVIADSNSNIVSETAPTIYGTKILKFKCRGASKIIGCKNGTTKRKWQRVWCSTDSTSPFANIVKGLSYGDIIYFFGTQSSSKYPDINTGRERSTTFCNLEFISVIVKADGETNNEIETEEDEFDDEFED